MRRHRAFTLLEFLITLVIISFALLGIAGAVSVSLKNDQSAYFRSQAVLLAGDIIDRMRANRPTAEAATSPYTLALCPTFPDRLAGSGVPHDDLQEWCDELDATFPPHTGTGSVSMDAATRKVTVVVQWDDSRGSGDPDALKAQQMTIETRL